MSVSPFTEVKTDTLIEVDFEGSKVKEDLSQYYRTKTRDRDLIPTKRSCEMDPFDLEPISKVIENDPFSVGERVVVSEASTNPTPEGILVKIDSSDEKVKERSPERSPEDPLFWSRLEKEAKEIAGEMTVDWKLLQSDAKSLVGDIKKTSRVKKATPKKMDNLLAMDSYSPANHSPILSLGPEMILVESSPEGRSPPKPPIMVEAKENLEPSCKKCLNTKPSLLSDDDEEEIIGKKRPPLLQSNKGMANRPQRRSLMPSTPLSKRTFPSPQQPKIVPDRKQVPSKNAMSQRRSLLPPSPLAKSVQIQRPNASTTRTFGVTNARKAPLTTPSKNMVPLTTPSKALRLPSQPLKAKPLANVDSVSQPRLPTNVPSQANKRRSLLATPSKRTSMSISTPSRTEGIMMTPSRNMVTPSRTMMTPSRTMMTPSRNTMTPSRNMLPSKPVLSMTTPGRRSLLPATTSTPRPAVPKSSGYLARPSYSVTGRNDLKFSNFATPKSSVSGPQFVTPSMSITKPKRGVSGIPSPIVKATY